MNRPIPRRLDRKIDRLVVVIALLFLGGLLHPHISFGQSASLPLSAYPRPEQDNGWGIHWAPTLLDEAPGVVDRYMTELDSLGIRWLKLMQADAPQLEHGYLLGQMAQRGMEPILRVYKPFNDPYKHLDSLVRAGVQTGVHYYELYANVNVAGLNGGWRPGQAIDVEHVVDVWLPAARTVRAAGGYPALPSLSPTGAVDDAAFLRQFLQALKARNALDALDGAWLPVQNYMGNLPVSDPRGFRRFETYHNILQEETGRVLPILSTEGGALVGDNWDAHYPAMTEELVAERTVAAYRFMQEQAPDYYFVFTPWLLVNAGAGGFNGSWEAHAWFPADAPPQPVVEAVKELAGGKKPASQPLEPPVQYAQEQAAPLTQEEPAAPAEVGAAAQERRGLDTKTDTPAPASSQPASPAAETTGPATSTSGRLLSSGKVTVQEGAVTLPTYDFEGAFVATTGDDPIYPAPRLAHDRVGPPTPKTYRTITLENDSLRLTLLPELGGRIYRWEDKQTGRDILYHNPVVKPTRWGVRGWWLAAGGMEWVVSRPDHGLYEYVPWQAEVIAEPDSAAVVLTHPGQQGLEVEVRISLSADARFFAVTPRLHNPTQRPISTHFWINAMLAPAPDNTVDPASRLVWPAEMLKVHGVAGSNSLRVGEVLSWPAGGGVDLSRVGRWPEHLSFFAEPGAQRSAVGLVDPNDALAVVRSFPKGLAPGVKAFYGPGLDPNLWTDGSDGHYFELWGGPNKDFDTPITLAAGQTLSWTEQWYAAPGLGAFVAANAHAALALEPDGGETLLRLTGVSSAARRGGLRLVVRADDRMIFSQRVSLPKDGFYETRLAAPRYGTHWLIQLFDSQNRVLLAYDSRLEPPAVEEEKPPIWDERLDELNIRVEPAPARSGQTYWKVVRADFENPQEGGGRHHIYIEVLDENGERLVGQQVEVFWPDGSTIVVTEDKPAPEYAANFPMYSDLGGYSVRIPGGLSDTVTGMGLPWGRMHVVYKIIFQRTVKP